MADQPNLLILMADQLTPRALKAYGGQVARTPSIDVLAKEGVVFDSFYCNSPLCAPSRFSFMAGQLPSQIGAYDNAAEFPAQIPTFAHYLRSAGYQTALSGKMHFCGPDQLHGFEERLTTDIYPSDFGWTPDWRNFDARPAWYHTMESVTQAGSCTRTNQIDFDDEVVVAARQKLFDIARGKDKRPFCLVVSMTHPHDPYVIPSAYWNRYRDEEIDMPRVADLAGRGADGAGPGPAQYGPEDPHSRRLRHVIGLNLSDPTESQIRAARRAYYGAVSYVDDQVGMLVSTLEQTELDRNTVIVVLADHGDMLGERGLWYKMNFFEPACRIPLIVHAPGRFSPRRVSGCASLLDLLPTFAALANSGTEPEYAAPIGGRNLLPAIEGRAVRDEVIGEYLAEGAIAPIVMIRRGRYKFVHSPADPDQLYDIAADPDERVNLAGQANHAAAVAEFRAEVVRRWDLAQLNEAVLASQQRRHFVYAALRQGRFQPWDFQPIRDASRLYIRNDQELNDLEAWRGFRAWRETLVFALLGLAAAGVASGHESSVEPRPEPYSCHTVRLADVGWTDVTATTAVLSQVLRRLGYEPQTTLLSVPVTFAVMKGGNIDVFLGNWMPAQTRDRQPYIDDGSIEIIRENLTGAKYTLAVPSRAYEAGIKDFSDIQRFGPALSFTIYGIEAGNDGNRHILTMIQHNDYGLGNFHLVESSEQGMLAEVARAYAASKPIVFLAWDPHPMNMQFDLRYLSGGDATFGPNYGRARVLTLARTGYVRQCPNVGRLLHNLVFTTQGESEIMRSILVEHKTPEVAAGEWLARNGNVTEAWLQGVQTFDGKVAGGAHAPGARPAEGVAIRFENWLTLHKLPVGAAVAVGIEWVKLHGAAVFRVTGAAVGGAIAAVYQALHAVPPILVILAMAAFAWWMQRSWALVAFVVAALLLIMNQGYWQQTLETLSLVLVATLGATAIGVPVGIASAHRPALAAALRPILDLMQTLPTFVYLIPTLVLFGLGVVPALISTVIFALPAPIRLTQLGVAGVPRSLLEAGEAFGATRWQILLKVELPSAAPLIVAGVTQCIMLSLSMVVIAALVGAGGLGVPVVRALNSVQVGMGVEAGVAIVLLAVILDRITRKGSP